MRPTERDWRSAWRHPKTGQHRLSSNSLIHVRAKSTHASIVMIECKALSKVNVRPNHMGPNHLFKKGSGPTKRKKSRLKDAKDKTLSWAKRVTLISSILATFPIYAKGTNHNIGYKLDQLIMTFLVGEKGEITLVTLHPSARRHYAD